MVCLIVLDIGNIADVCMCVSLMRCKYLKDKKKVKREGAMWGTL